MVPSMRSGSQIYLLLGKLKLKLIDTDVLYQTKPISFRFTFDQVAKVTKFFTNDFLKLFQIVKQLIKTIKNFDKNNMK